MSNEPADFDSIPSGEPSHEQDLDFQLNSIAQKEWVEEHKPHYTLDITSGRIPRPPWLFDDFLLSHSLTLVSGEPFAGKSLFLLALALSLDSGEPLFGSFQPAPHQRVLFIGQDSPTWDYLGQAQKLALGMSASHTNGSMLLLNKGIDLLSGESLQIIEQAIDLFNINVLMLDTLLELHNLDENSNTEMKRLMGLLKHLRDKHYLSIFATTHTAKAVEGKSANYRARGASVISGSVDQHIIIRTHYAASKTNGFYFKVPKSRGADRPVDNPVVKFVVGESSGKETLKLEYAQELYSERQAVVTNLLSKGPISRKDIALALRARYPEWSDVELQRRTTNTIAYLETKHIVRKVERGIYELVKNPEPLPNPEASQTP